MVLDLLKFSSDDAFYTEAHARFLLDGMRALLLERKYRLDKRERERSILPDENLQTICLDLEPEDGEDGVCGTGAGQWLRSVQAVPKTLGIGSPKVYPLDIMLGEKFTLVAIERLPFVGRNKWLSRFIYVAIGPDRKLRVAGGNAQYRYLRRVRLSAAFSDPEEAAALSCDEEGNSTACDPLDMTFPLEDDLISTCVELTVSELLGSRYTPQDKDNDALDGLQEKNVTYPKSTGQAQSQAQDVII